MTDSYFAFSKDWRQQASCKGKNTDDFFPVAITKSNIDSIRSIYSMCANCPVISHCFYEAMLYDYDGIWAHTTYKQRKAYLKYFLNNDLENFTFLQAQQLINQIVSSNIQPNSTYKKTIRLVVNSKISNSDLTSGAENV